MHQVISRPSTVARRPARAQRWTHAALALLLAAVLLLPAVAAGTYSAATSTGYDWLQFDGNGQHSGNNALESTITPGNVGSLHLLFQVALPFKADSAPVYLSGITTPGGVKDLLFLLTKDGRIMALDAHNGSTVWSHQIPPGSCQFPNGNACFSPATPAIDPNRQYVY